MGSMKWCHCLFFLAGHFDHTAYLWEQKTMSDVQINTIVQHYVCRIFQETAKMLGVPVIAIPEMDARRLKQAAVDLEEVLTHFVRNNAPAPQ